MDFAIGDDGKNPVIVGRSQAHLTLSPSPPSVEERTVGPIWANISGW